MNKGFFISFEGGEGAGKSTVIDRIKLNLEERGTQVLATREPGGIAIAEQIRAVILDKDNIRMDGRTEALLYAAARRQHLVERVRPALERGMTVLCDRFIDSSLAYQGHARGLGIAEIWTLNAFATDGLQPQLTFFLDLDPEIGLSRIRSHRMEETNRLDEEGLAFHRKVREGYLLVCAQFPQRIVKIDANRNPTEVFNEIMTVIHMKMQEL